MVARLRAKFDGGAAAAAGKPLGGGARPRRGAWEVEAGYDKSRCICCVFVPGQRRPAVLG